MTALRRWIQNKIYHSYSRLHKKNAHPGHLKPLFYQCIHTVVDLHRRLNDRFPLLFGMCQVVAKAEICPWSHYDHQETSTRCLRRSTIMQLLDRCVDQPALAVRSPLSGNDSIPPVFQHLCQATELVSSEDIADASTC